jgi:competence protein ComEA helix-hairpin-helix repeat region
MFDLEKREKFILLALTAILLVGIAIGLHQKRAIRAGVKPGDFTYFSKIPSAEDPSIAKSKININDSGLAGLKKLKGVGDVLAGRIIEYRSTNGDFRSVEELKKVKGVGQKLYENIKDRVSVD